MDKNRNDTFFEWFGEGFKGVITIAVSLMAFFAQQMSTTMKELTVAIRAIEIRVTSIEVARDSSLASYQKMGQDVQEMKNQITQVMIMLKSLEESKKR